MELVNGYSQIGDQVWQGDGGFIATDQVRARDADGLKLTDDSGNGLLILDGGDIRFGGTSNYAQISSIGDLTFAGTGDYLVASNAFAFRAAADQDTGLYFNSSTSAFQFLDTAGNISFSAGGSTARNMGIGLSVLGGSAQRNIGITLGAPPTTYPANMFHFYGKDQTAGNTCPHFTTENGTVVLLYQQAHIIDADGNLADITTKFNTLLTYLENMGMIATS